MQKVHGIAATSNGTFIFSTVCQTSEGWKILKVHEWGCQSFFHNYLLLHKPVNLALPSFWLKQAPADTSGMIFLSTEAGLSASTNLTEYDFYSNILEHNLVGIYPDDALLATLPRFFSTAPQSFISLFYDAPAVKAGIIINNTLMSVYSAIVETQDELAGFMGRIERYWNQFNPALSFPVQQFQLNAFPFETGNMTDITIVKCGTDDPDTLKSAGGALCSQDNPVPAFNHQSNKTRPGIFRTLFLGVSLFLLTTAILTTTLLFVFDKYYADRLNTAKSQYQNILNNNNEIRQLISKGDLLSQKVLLHNDRILHPTTWGKFLHFLGTSRPSGLHFERLGTEPANDADKIRVAITGWSSNETNVTEFIKKVSKSSIVKNISLSSMERIRKQDASCHFKIICILSLSEK